MLMLIACIAMLTDHVGYVFFHDTAVFRIIGRLAMPIYAYFIVSGYIHTSDMHKYLKRIALNALLSEIPFTLMLDKSELNVCFTWLSGLLIIYGIDNRKYLLSASVTAVTILIQLAVPIDYGLYGVAWVVLFYIRHNRKGYIGNLTLIIGTTIIYMIWREPIQFLAMAAIPIIIFAEKYNLTRTKSKALKKLYQYFYPLHMTVIDILKFIWR